MRSKIFSSHVFFLLLNKDIKEVKLSSVFALRRRSIKDASLLAFVTSVSELICKPLFVTFYTVYPHLLTVEGNISAQSTPSNCLSMIHRFSSSVHCH